MQVDREANSDTTQPQSEARSNASALTPQFAIEGIAEASGAGENRGHVKDLEGRRASLMQRSIFGRCAQSSVRLTYGAGVHLLQLGDQSAYSAWARAAAAIPGL